MLFKMFASVRFITTIVGAIVLLNGALAFGGARSFLKRQMPSAGEMPAKSVDEQQQQRKPLEPYTAAATAQFQLLPFLPAPAYYGTYAAGLGAPPQQQKRFDYAPSESYGGYDGFYPFMPAKRFDVGGFGAAYGSRGRFSGFL